MKFLAIMEQWNGFIFKRDRETGRPRGFAFVEMESEANEDKAIEALDGAEWMERQLKVNKARPRKNRNSFSGGRNNRF